MNVIYYSFCATLQLCQDLYILYNNILAFRNLGLVSLLASFCFFLAQINIYKVPIELTSL
jgi:hypothetical protein